ncbi:MAG: adenylate/guanylate cyclase domain-containing protein [candidate division KSB1 bacterium]|nr:adenylate/guanylate cyclase domain-containing protein [candidate division KSB1 bacterium]
MKGTFPKTVVACLLGLVAAGATGLVTELPLKRIFEGFEAKTLDWRYAQRLSRLASQRAGAALEDIVIVDIDDRSLEKLGPFNQWPRTYHAKVIDYLTSGKALAIGFDVLFMEPSRDPMVDDSLTAATSRADVVYHAMAFSAADPDIFLYAMDAPPPGFQAERFSFAFPPRTTTRLPSAERMDGKIVRLYNSAAGIGFVNFTPDDDSVIRRMPMFITFAGRQYPALSLAIIRGLLNLSPEHIGLEPGKRIVLSPPQSPGQRVVLPVDSRGRMLINYLGTMGTFRYVSYYDVLMERVPAEIFEGRIVLVGTSAAGLADIRPVPFQGAFPGVEIHATIIHNILHQQFINRPGKVAIYLLAAVLAVAVAMMAMSLRPWFSGPLVLLLGAAFLVVNFQLFARSAIWVEMVRPMLTLLFSYLGVFIFRYVEEERNKRKIKGMFQYYLSASVVDELIKNPQMLKLGGERRMATAFFSDIKDFTSVSEGLSPEELVAHLNEYLSAMTAIVFAHQGFLDKYEGDAIMAVFGVPVPIDGHAVFACRAALEMQRRLSELRPKWQAEGKPQFHARIGINSGPMIAGNIGGEQRFDYTVIGDSVNLASRLEGANKAYGTSIMISAFTHELLNGQFVTRELDFIRVKGKALPVRVYELVAEHEDELSATRRQALQLFAEGLQAYRDRRWDEALALFQAALALEPEDGPAQVYCQRCTLFRQNPPPPDWDGVFEMKTK